jgi:hypothetical protein
MMVPMSANTGTRRLPRTTILIVVDGLALLLFVVAGLRSHHEGTALTIFARNAVPLLASWFGFSAILGTYRRPGLGTLLRNWTVAVPVALVVRSVWVGSPTGWGFLTFLGVGLAFTLLFLMMGRAAAILVSGRGYPERGAAQ